MEWTDPDGDHLPLSLVVVNDQSKERTDWALELARLFGLTRAESRVAAALCDGRSLSAYAGRNFGPYRAHASEARTREDRNS